jgi:hypothetical protein
MATVTERDREMARRLPDEFLESPDVEAIDRVVQLVAHYWGYHKDTARADLVRVLLPTLRRLLEPEIEPTAVDRDVCEAMVASWLAGQ